MEIKDNRDKVVKAFREALGRDKTRTQVFSISDLGLVEMTRKRIGEGLLESIAHRCDVCRAVASSYPRSCWADPGTSTVGSSEPPIRPPVGSMGRRA